MAEEASDKAKQETKGLKPADDAVKAEESKPVEAGGKEGTGQAAAEAPATKPPDAAASPARLHLGEGWSQGGLDVSIVDAAVEWCYVGIQDANVCARDGASYLWIHVMRSNANDASAPPIHSCLQFSLLYEGERLQPLGNVEAKDQVSWSDGGCAELAGGSADDGWVYFEVPDTLIMEQAVLDLSRTQGPPSHQAWLLVEAE